MNMWSWLGSLILIAGGIVHFVVVDLSVWILRASYVRWFPDSLLDSMKTTVIDWGILGSNKVLFIFAGYSLWVVMSLIVIGLYNLFIFRHIPPGHPIRRQSLILSASATSVFALLAIVCFIYPAALGALLAILCFVLALRKETVPPISPEVL